MNKKLILISSLLVLTLFVISACEEGAVGWRPWWRGTTVPEYDACNMVWYEEGGLIIRTDYDYTPIKDTCLNGGYRPYLGKKMVDASCLNITECNSNKWIGECKNKNQLKSICK